MSARDTYSVTAVSVSDSVVLKNAADARTVRNFYSVTVHGSWGDITFERWPYLAAPQIGDRFIILPESAT